MSLQLISLNVRGLRDEAKRKSIFNFYRSKCNVLCMQETHSCQNTSNIWSSEWRGVSIYAHGTSAARGVAILFKKDFYCNITDICGDPNGRYLICRIEQNQKTFVLCNIYAPNADSPNFFRDLDRKLSSMEGEKIVVGDFNLVLNPLLDRRNPVSANNNKSVEVLDSMCTDHYYVDVWRARNPGIRRYSWYRTRPKLSASRLDFALSTVGITDQIQCIFLHHRPSQRSLCSLHMYRTAPT